MSRLIVPLGILAVLSGGCLPSFPDRSFSEDPEHDFDGDGLSELDGDCDDAQATAYPDGEEICDGIDNDCDGNIDEPTATDASTWYGDEDRDGYGADTFTLTSCTQPDGFSAESGDCDDAVAAINPAATETCDGTDNDCDGLIDEADPSMEGEATWYLDRDGDYVGDESESVESCDQPSASHVRDAGDCDDTDASIHPRAEERCNEKDDDCDGLIDDDDAVESPAVWTIDADGDGYGSAATSAATLEQCTPPDGYVEDASDCDDSDASVSPDGEEVCNEIDDDCDDVVDDGVQTTYFDDSDGDGYGNIAISQGACETPPSGFVSDATDCDDLNASVHPDADEYCDEIDNDCDEYTDESDAVDATVWYRDADEDGYGDDVVSEASCSAISGYVDVGGDCEDAMDGINPGATETCYTTDDDDCSGSTNDEGATACVTWYLDDDGDGYGTEDDDACLCVAEGSYRSRVTGDCDDSDTTISPDDLERCDSVDNDCDGDTDEEDADDCTAYFYDWDGDGYGINDSRCLCSDDGYYRTMALGDCDDEDAGVSPDTLMCGLYGEISSDTSVGYLSEGVVHAGGAAVKAFSGDFDYDLDGYTDIVAASTGFDSSYTDAGAVFLFRGPVSGEHLLDSTTDADMVVTSTQPQSYFGSEVSAGDFDGDYRDELLISAWGSGQSYFVDDGMNGIGTLTTSSVGVEVLGYGSVRALSDVNDDGFDDAVVASGTASTTYRLSSGYIAYGSLSGLIPDTSGGDFFDGRLSGSGNAGSIEALTAGGDVDSDGVSDLIAYTHSYWFLRVHLGPSTAGGTLSLVPDAEVNIEASEPVVSFIGDLNDDGYGDVVYGEYAYDGYSSTEGDLYNSGIVLVFIGDATGLQATSEEDANWILLGEDHYDEYGFDFGGGDINGDRSNDIVISSKEGRPALLYYGPLVDGSYVQSDADASFSFLNPEAVHSAGDVDSDGYDDLLVGSVDDEIYLFLGGP